MDDGCDAGSKNVVDEEALFEYIRQSEGIRSALGVGEEDLLGLTPFAQGEYNANFRLDVEGRDPLLVRVNLGSQMGLVDQIGYEMSALRLLEPSGRTPRALFVDGSRTSFPFGVGVETLLPGRPLDYGTDLAEAAHILADVHAVVPGHDCSLVRPEHPLAAIVEECEWMYARYRAWSSADEAVEKRAELMFSYVEPLAERDRASRGSRAEHVVNTELNSSNFLVNPGATSYLVDWEKPVLGEVEQDLAHFLVPTTTFWKTDVILTQRQREDFVEEYLGAVGGRFDTGELAGRLHDYEVVTCLRGVTWCAMALTEYLGGGRALTNTDTLAKIRQYLSPSFLDRLLEEWFSGRGAAGMGTGGGQ